MSEESDKYAKLVLSTDTKPSGAFAGQLIIETDTGKVYEWTGAEWLNTRTVTSIGNPATSVVIDGLYIYEAHCSAAHEVIR